MGTPPVNRAIVKLRDEISTCQAELEDVKQKPEDAPEFATVSKLETITKLSENIAINEEAIKQFKRQ